MKRLALLGSWKRLGIQAGLLAGLGLAFVSGGEPQPAKADNHCPVEDDCSFKKPNFMIILDYSSSMNAEWVPGQSRWEAAVEAVQNLVTANNGYFDDNAHIAMMRYCHDPNPGQPGTVIPVDQSGLVDGVRLDVHWYDPNGPLEYFECNGDAVVQALNQIPHPPCEGANCAGCGTWTNGALLYARDIIEQSRIDHPDDVIENEERFYANLLLTDGVWCPANGGGAGGLGCANNQPIAEHDPAPTAADMYENMGVPTYVVAIGEAVGTQFNDEIAQAGGTGQALEPGVGQLIPALQSVVDDIINSVIVPSCVGGMPRIMVVLDASSSMLNVNGVAGGQGQTGWDQTFQALTGANGLFMTEVNLGTQTIWGTTPKVEDLSHMGLIVYGSQNEEDILVNYGPCMRDNWEWALDPNTSCVAPGCNDPWSGPPITWTFLESPPENGPHGFPFDQPTKSHMPQCQPHAGLPGGCTGSATHVHRGLELASQNIDDYKANPPALYPVNDNTRFVNIHITDGAYLTSNCPDCSTNAQVSAALVGMYNEGITTYTIGFGDLTAGNELNNMACWGSGGSGTPCNGGDHGPFDAGNQQQLEMALQTIIESIAFDPCCAFNDCAYVPEPSTSQPDPVPGEITASTGESGDTAGEDTTTGPTTSDDESMSGPDTTQGSQSDSNSGSETGDDPTAASSPTSVTMSGGETGDGTGDETGGQQRTDDGCGCTTGSDDPRGLLGMLVLLGLGTAARRRRLRS